MEQDPALDNLVHAAGYRTGPLDRVGRVDEAGTGDRPMILIAGAGFDGDVFEGFIARRSSDYRFYSVTLPGFGGTAAPPMPSPGVSYGEQSWTRSAERGIERLIAERDLDDVVVVAHWVGATGIGMRLALDRPDRVRALVVISGVPRWMSPNPSASPVPESLAERIRLVDHGYAPQWFKTVTRDTWDDNNYLPGDYARHPLRALQLWRQAASAPLPVLVRYTLESWAQDATVGLDRLEVPTLVVIPGFGEDHWQPAGRPYMKAFCQDGWGAAEGASPHLRVVTIPDTRVFIMDDQPEALDRAVDAFLAGSPQA